MRVFVIPTAVLMSVLCAALCPAVSAKEPPHPVVGHA